MATIQKYNSDNFNSVLKLLNEAKEFDHFTKELLEEKLYGDPDWNIDSTYVAEDKSQIIGFMQGVVRDIMKKKYGYIKLLAVDKNYRRQGIATKMYLKLEEYFKKNDVNVIRIYDVPLNYFMPGIDPRYTEAVCFAEKNGFKRFDDSFNMDVDLDYSDWKTDDSVEKLKKEGFEMRRARETDRQKVYELISKEWNLWKNEIDMAFKSNPTALFIAIKNNKVLAFSAYNGNNVGTGWFGPMGTLPELRGKGIGGILFYMCLKDIKNSGLKKSTIPWVAPISFYANYANARISRTFWRYEKEL